MPTSEPLRAPEPEATSWLMGLAAALRKASRAAALWLGLWGALAAGLLAAVAFVAIEGVEPLEAFLLARYVPQRAIKAAHWLITHFADAQIRTAIVTTTITGGMLLVSATLFAVKEKASAVFEHDSQITADLAWREPPLWRLALEELWLVLVYAALSALSFWIGYGGGKARMVTALALTQVVMAFTLTVDYVAPAMQRHGWRYTQILRQVVRRPLLILGFGVCFGAPAIVALQVLGQPAAHELILNLGVIVAVQLAGLMGALWVGTYAGARLCTELHQPSAPGLPITAHVATWALLLFTGASLGTVSIAAYRALPLLKCEYALVPGSWSLGLGHGAGVRLEFDLRIHNPTHWDAKLAKHRIEIRHGGDTLAEAILDPFEIDAGSTATRPAAFELDAKSGLAKKSFGTILDIKRKGWRAAGSDLLSGASQTDAYAVTLYLPTPVMDFPIYLTESAKPGAK